MGDTLYKQTFTVSMPTTIPDTVLGVNLVNFMNSAMSSAEMNTAIASVLTLDKMVNWKVQSIQVTGAVWYGGTTAKPGQLTLHFNVTTVSDPIDVDGIIAVVAGVALIILAVLLAIPSFGVSIGFVPVGIAAIFGGGAFIAGFITVTAGSLSIFSTSGGITGVITGTGSGDLGTIAIIAGIGVAGVIAYMYLKEPKRHAAAHRYVGKAKSAAKSAARRLR